MQFLPCGHQYSCDDCCSRWKKCKCGGVIDKKVDVITDDKGESGAIQVRSLRVSIMLVVVVVFVVVDFLYVAVWLLLIL